MADWSDVKTSLAGQGTLLGNAETTISGGACTVTVGGIQTVVRAVAGLTVAVGDTLLIVRQGSVYWAIGVAAAAPAVPPAPPPPPDVPDPSDSAPTPKPTVTTGTLTVAPVATATYRDGKWRTDIGPAGSADTYQGRYAGSSYGRMTGCAFYGSKPRTISGATVTKAVIKARRLSAGDFAARTATLRLLTQSTRPAGAPTLNESTSGPSLAVNSTTNAFTIPTSWAQAMVDGTRGGLAIFVNADSPHIRLAGRGSWSAAWTLTINWRRG